MQYTEKHNSLWYSQMGGKKDTSVFKVVVINEIIIEIHRITKWIKKNNQDGTASCYDWIRKTLSVVNSREYMQTSYKCTKQHWIQSWKQNMD